MSVVSGNVPGALLLDEMFSPAIANDLTARGIDCRAVVTDPVLRALSDLEIFQAALEEGRILVTNNVPDFESLRRSHEAAGNKVPGTIYTSHLTFPRTKAHMSRLAAALADAATGHEAARRGGVLWLRPARDSLKQDGPGVWELSFPELREGQLAVAGRRPKRTQSWSTSTPHTGLYS